jgi:hypothetical protein
MTPVYRKSWYNHNTMRKKKPRVAFLDEVRITREGEAALIEFADESIASTHLTIGPSMLAMTDRDILDCYNDGVRAQEHLRATYQFVAIEIPAGKPQIQYSAQCNQWSPRGDVLRCAIEDDASGGPIIHIDDQELSWEEFGRLLSVHAGWGMRIKFVPDDSILEEPTTEVREPKDGER